MLVGGPTALFMMEKISPTYVGRGGLASAMRLITMISATCGFMFMYQRSCSKQAPITSMKAQVRC